MNLTKNLQDCVMEHAWDGVWSRDGLDRKTGKVVTLSLLIAPNADSERLMPLL